MNTKLAGSLLAAFVTFGGATYLAQPAQAAAGCTAEEAAYAQGFASGYCGAQGLTGTVNACDAGGGFSFYCGNEH